MPEQLLWADDDGSDRFSYEIEELRRRGWAVTWARDITEAAGLLSERRFDAMLLDQMFPFRKGSGVTNEPQPRVWGGATLLWWLRRREPPPQMPFADGVPNQPFFATPALLANQSLPVAIVSGYYDALVDRVTRSASPADLELRLVEKPVELTDLTDFLERARQAVERRAEPTR